MYELVVIGKAGDADSVFSKVEKIVKDAQASGLKVKKMGKRPLAYPIAKQTEADYFLFNFEAPGDSVKIISESLRLEQEDILRYLIIKTKHGFEEIGVGAVASTTKEPVRQKKVEKVKVEVKAKVTKAKKDTKVSNGKNGVKTKEVLTKKK